ncbi:MAG: hypothetical protein RMI94_13995 [Bryobacterales bacterium]|nr:hypothetical protein [Bryobacteraceae bacterium]MDW8131659.1 hypothetical protein [Bryobacterales bacterium]
MAMRLPFSLLLLAGIVASAGSLAASTVSCLPLVLPDGSTIAGLCGDDSWFPLPPWWYLPLTPPEPSPPPLPPYVYLPDPGPPLPPSEFFLLAFGSGWAAPEPLAEPPAYLFLPDPPELEGPVAEHAPEPGGLALIGLGLLVLGILGRWRSARRAR